MYDRRSRHRAADTARRGLSSAKSRLVDVTRVRFPEYVAYGVAAPLLPADDGGWDDTTTSRTYIVLDSFLDCGMTK